MCKLVFLLSMAGGDPTPSEPPRGTVMGHLANKQSPMDHAGSSMTRTFDQPSSSRSYPHLLLVRAGGDANRRCSHSPICQPPR
ncbi:hypothetical protein K466DRAFT_580373 [Polyporus arcularius HHB13444]|uniref:Uncharacterized protein n=1 Tax=Polyporus arcularius HHB13444 TaxID=1314778 RepID=A0A5C3PW46_9APHY|nr:hypothetical protein K466DRAFT_580373 [Polyporus arcularius HHB13444]